MGTRGWMGGVSRQAASTLKPETLICSASETPNKSPSLARLQVPKGLHIAGGFVKLHIACSARHKASFWRKPHNGTTRELSSNGHVMERIG